MLKNNKGDPQIMKAALRVVLNLLFLVLRYISTRCDGYRAASTTVIIAVVQTNAVDSTGCSSTDITASFGCRNACYTASYGDITASTLAFKIMGIVIIKA